MRYPGAPPLVTLYPSVKAFTSVVPRSLPLVTTDPASEWRLHEEADTFLLECFLPETLRDHLLKTPHFHLAPAVLCGCASPNPGTHCYFFLPEGLIDACVCVCAVSAGMVLGTRNVPIGACHLSLFFFF